MLRALIGSHGTIGSTLLDHISVDYVFNSDNLLELQRYQFDQVIIAAPSGNRLAINRGDTQDHDHCRDIGTAIGRCCPAHVVVIGSVDAVTAPTTPYGQNRAALERYITAAVPMTSILRLSTLIGTRIKKNILHDIKHNLFLDRIDAMAEIQWCILDDLPRLIATARPGTVQDIVSEPIANWEILQHFRPDLTYNSRASTVRYNQQPYVYTKDEIFAAMEQYLK